MNAVAHRVIELRPGPGPAALRQVGSPAVFVGGFGDETRETIRHASGRADAESVIGDSPRAAQRILCDPGQAVPRCIFVDSATPGLESFIAWVRGQGRLFSVPVVVMVPAAADPVYREAHAYGADDVLVRTDGAGVTRRLANLGEFDPASRPPLTQGRALIGHLDEPRRRVLGRILRQAGFDVAFGADPDELAKVARDGGEPPGLLVVADDLPGTGAVGAIDAVRAAAPADGTTPAAVVLAQDADAARGVLGSRPRVAVGSDSAPADNLLFLANELLRPDVRNVRASDRLLHGTICSFRPAGALEPVHGLTYNISREGLYVRTLDPPTPGTSLWFEMRPPGAVTAVHLRGKTVWTRGLRSPGGAAPPGFGMRIDAERCPPEDLQAYQQAYETLRQGLAE